MKQATVLVLMISVLGGCGSAPEPAATPASDSSRSANASPESVRLTEEQFQRADIATASAQTKPLYRLLKVNGIVEAPPEKKHTISFPLGGYLKSNNLIPGMYVKKGTLLAVLEDAAFIQLQQDYLLRKSKLEFLETDYYRQEALSKTQSNSQKAFQQARVDYESQKITSRALAEQLRLIGILPDTLTEKNISRTVRVYAPISGYVSKVNVNPGKYVAPTDVLFEIIDPSRLHISLTVFQQDAAALRRGQQVTFTSNALGGKKWPATIHLVSPDLNESRAAEVHCEIDKPVPGLLPGSFVNAEIQVGDSDGVVLPDAAVVKWQNQHFIFTEEEMMTYRMVPVAIGNAVGGFTEITTALPDDKKIVIANAYTLLTMMKNTPEE